MIKWIWTLAFIGLISAQNITKSEVKVENKEIVGNSASEKNNKSVIPGIADKKIVLSELPVLSDKVMEVQKNVDKSEPSDDLPGAQTNPISPAKYISLDDNGLFLKYNYVFLTIVSLSVVAVIVYKTHRMKQSRAELKYGKAIDELEKEQLNPSSKNRWLEESSDDEDKDTLFDINFLKNARTNAAHV